MKPETMREIDFSDEIRAEDLLTEWMGVDYRHDLSPMENAVQYIETLRRDSNTR